MIGTRKVVTKTPGGHRAAWPVACCLVLLGWGAAPPPAAAAAPCFSPPALVQAASQRRPPTLQAGFTDNILGNRSRMIQATLVVVIVGIYILVWRR